MHILQITDLHLHGSARGTLRGVETDSTLRAVLASATAAGTDFAAILVTGDLVQDDPSGYERFQRTFGDTRMPVLCIPGNHDEPDAMRRSLSQPPFAYCGEHIVGGWQFVMLDSCDPGHVGGRLLDGELRRRDAALQASSANAIVCLHHHPVSVGSRWLDEIGLTNAEEFWAVIDAHPNVRGVLWGHVHQAYAGQRRGIALLGTPSTCAQFLPYSDRYALDANPPAYRRLLLHDDGLVESELCWVPAVAHAVQ
ncbi:MAG: 3',5'-cyclic-AMP phosphodiesterase [Steroidobacteraceae bacterium]